MIGAEVWVCTGFIELHTFPIANHDTAYIELVVWGWRGAAQDIMVGWPVEDPPDDSICTDCDVLWGKNVILN